MSSRSTTRPITRDDLEAKFRQLQGGTEAGVNTARGMSKAVPVVLGVAAVGIAYLVGRRRGRRRRTVVEVRRV